MHVLRMKGSYQNDTLAISVDFKKNNNKISLAAGIAEALIALVIFSFWYPLWDSRFIDNPDWFSDVIVLRFGMALTFLMIALFSKAKLLPQKAIF